MCEELIITAATGYQSTDIEPFIHSLLQNTSAMAAIVIQESDRELHGLLRSNPRIRLFSIKPLSDPRHMVIKSFKIFKKIIDTIKPHKVLLSDSRDVFFQDSPISKEISTGKDSYLLLAEEPIEIKKCPINSKWIKRFFPSEDLIKIGDQNVICAGTVGGQTQAVLELLEHLCDMLENKQAQLQATPWGLDQACLNLLIHSKKLPIQNVFFSSNNTGPWLTLHHESSISINRQGFVTAPETPNNRASLIHQYDRIPWLARHLKNQLL